MPKRSSIVSLAAFLLLLALPAVIQASESPYKDAEAVAQAYFDAMRTGDWHGMARLMDPNEIGKLKHLVVTLFSSAPEDDPEVQEAVAFMFGPDVRAADLAATDPADLLAGLLYTFHALTPIIYESIEILGSVPEGSDLIHTVTRFTADIGDIDVTQVVVISLRLVDGMWRVIPSGELDAVISALEQAIMQMTP